jgi:hypothetical protein
LLRTSLDLSCMHTQFGNEQRIRFEFRDVSVG